MYYHERQYGTLLIIILLIVIVLNIVAYLTQIGNNPLTLAPTIIVPSLLLVILLLMYDLKTTVDTRAIYIIYGIGLIRKQIALTDISSVEVVRSSAMQGAGIHMGMKGTTYNISFTDSVRLNLYSSKRYVEIGTPDPMNLMMMIEQARKELPQGKYIR